MQRTADPRGADSLTKRERGTVGETFCREEQEFAQHINLELHEIRSPCAS